MKLFTLSYFIVLLVSCNTNSKQTLHSAMAMADTAGLPKDSLAFYFPANVFYDRPSSDSFLQNWYGSALYSFKEPILSQHFGGHSVYRFLWLRSFHRPVVFTMHKADDEVWLTTKMLDKQPRFRNERVLFISEKERKEYLEQGFVADSHRADAMIKYADRKATIVYNKHLPLSSDEWNEFEQLLRKADFWHLPADIDAGDTDGAMWVFEGRLKDQYHVVSNHSPENVNYTKAGLYLIKLSGLQEEIY